MENLLLTSSIPYWIAFVLMIACFAVCYIYRHRPDSDDRPISRNLMLAVSAACLSIAIFEIAVYLTIGPKCLWWCTADDLGFFGKLLRELPLITFLFLQVIQVFFYKQFMDNYLRRDMSIMPSAIGFLGVLPVCIILYIILSFVDISKENRDMIFYIVLGVMMTAAIGYSLFRNIKESGLRNGAVFTVVTSLLLWASLISLLLFIASIIELLFQTAILIVGLYFGKSVFRGMNNAMVYNSDQKTIYRDMDGDLHYTSSGAQQANERIARKRSRIID